jgi:hypothetical protein
MTTTQPHKRRRVNNGAAASTFAGSTLGELLDLLARTAPGVRLDALDALGASLGTERGQGITLALTPCADQHDCLLTLCWCYPHTVTHPGHFRWMEDGIVTSAIPLPHHPTSSGTIHALELNPTVCWARCAPPWAQSAGRVFCSPS